MALGPRLLATRDQQRRDDAHGFLCVVGSVPQAIRTGREEPKMAKRTFSTPALNSEANPAHCQHDQITEHQTDSAREDEEDHNWHPSAEEQRMETSLRDRGAGESAYDRM